MFIVYQIRHGENGDAAKFITNFYAGIPTFRAFVSYFEVFCYCRFKLSMDT